MITLIAALDENYLIGKENTIPWNCPDDLKVFKKFTNNCPIIMGRNTYESLPGILPNRIHFVITSDASKVDVSEEELESVHICSSLFEAINGASALSNRKNDYVKIDGNNIKVFKDEIFIIGGQMLYHDVMEKDLVDRVILSKMKLAVEPDRTCKYFYFTQWQPNFSLIFERDMKEFVLQIWDRDPSKKWIK